MDALLVERPPLCDWMWSARWDSTGKKRRRRGTAVQRATHWTVGHIWNDWPGKYIADKRQFLRRTGYCQRTVTNQRVRSAGVKPRVATVVARGPEDQSEGCRSLAGDSLSQLPPGTDRGLGAPSRRLGSENQNRGGIHPSPNELHSAGQTRGQLVMLRRVLLKREIGARGN